jgi:hypothetical protein
MKSIVYSVALLGCLSAGNILFAQGRSGGRAGGPVEIPTRPEPAATRPSTDTDRGNRPATDRTTNTNSQASAKKAEGTKDPSIQLTDNPALLTRLKTIYPDKTDQQLAVMAKDFDNLGQFIAAVHVSNNLGIPWDDLKMNMTTGGMSLGKAIQASKPELSVGAVDAEVKKAEAQAKKDTSGKS